MKKYTIVAATLIIAGLSSCSPRLVGNWNIASYESKTENGQDIKVANIGNIQFKKNNSGVKKVNYSVFENKVEDNTAFTWKKAADGESITINSEGSVLNKTWLIIKDEKKYQKWKSTDGTNTIQVLELKK